MRQINKKTFRRFVAVGYGILVAFLVYVVCYSESPVGMALSLAPVLALILFTVTVIIAANTRRPLGVIDLVRIVCWILFAAGYGVSNMATSYYIVSWPQYSALAQAVGDCVVGGSLMAVLLVSLLWPIPKRHPSHCCSHCGYNLTGNTSGVCPECGETT